MTGCLAGRGETVTSTPGFCFAKVGRRVRRKALEVWCELGTGDMWMNGWDVLHPPTTSRPVAVVEVEALAL